MECPTCKEGLRGRGTNYHCEQCNVDYVVKFTCERCGRIPEEIASCGSVSYFCNTCNELKSRQSMKKEFTEK